MIDITGLREDKRPQSSTIVHALLDRLEAAEKDVALKEEVIDSLGVVVKRLDAQCDAAERERDECNRRRLEAADHFAAQTALMKKKYDDLRAKIEAMERQEPVAWARKLGLDVPSFGCVTDLKYRPSNIPESSYIPLYTLPGAQNVPEKLCYDSRWEISIDYVDGWNAAVDMMRGKSPSWHCPDCCIAFPFGAPKSCPNDDARCNSLLAAAPEAKP